MVDSYFIALGLFVLLLVVAVSNRKAAWSVPLGAVVAMIGAWYLIEPYYFPELFEEFDPIHIRTAYDSVSIFFVALLVLAPVISRKFEPGSKGRIFSTNVISGDRIVIVVMVVWLLLLAFGTWRMSGDVVKALFPLGGRTDANMWSRAAGAGAGSDGFIVSTAAYIYVLCLASFGLLLFFVERRSSRILLMMLILVSWPYAFLQGSRNIALATVGPAGLAFLLFGRVPVLTKALVAMVGLLVLDFSFRIVIAYRNAGFSDVDVASLERSSHLGLNMASELVYITTFLNDGTLHLSYGAGYLAELANVIPRAVWPGKPLVGIDYAIARGFGDSSIDIGVFATLSTGAIGQAVTNFGSMVGPVVAALLLSLWVAMLSRFRLQGTPLRSALFLVGLGLTFNLGRDISLLVLWPMVFGYLGVLLFESNERQRQKRLAAKRQLRDPIRLTVVARPPTKSPKQH